MAEAPAGPRGWKLFFRLPSDAMANGTNPLMLLDELRALGDAHIVARTNDVPSLEELVATECHVGWDVTLIGEISRDDIEDVFIFVMDDMTLDIEPLSAEPASLAEPVIADPAVVPTSAPVVVEVDGSSAGVRPAAKAGESVRVPAERLDALMDRVGELVIAQSRLSQLAHGGVDLLLRSVSEEIERLTSELRDTMMMLRMVPVASLFGRFRRLVHDLARDTGKAIELVTEGEATEIDKTVIERLFDPLVHIVRNSCDHGVEPGRYVIPLTAVEECLELSLEEDMRSRGRSFITLRDRLVPFLRLRDMFATGTRPDTYQKIVVVTTGTDRVGLVVDQIIGNHQTVIKPMSSLHADVANFAGATILGDGGVALILDIAQLVATAQPKEERLRAAG